MMERNMEIPLARYRIMHQGSINSGEVRKQMKSVVVIPIENTGSNKAKRDQCLWSPVVILITGHIDQTKSGMLTVVFRSIIARLC